MLNSSTGLFSFQFSSTDGLNSMLENGEWCRIGLKHHGVPVLECLSKRSGYARVMIELRADMELKDNIMVVMPKIIREGYYTCTICVEYEWKPPTCSRLLKVGFKPHKEYRPVPKKPTSSPSSNKKKGVAHTNEVSNSNSFDVLNSVDNDMKLDTNRGTTNLVNNRDNSKRIHFL
ncbi:hypothetical protein Tco_0569891 [Tanacetum coccineum]